MMITRQDMLTLLLTILFATSALACEDKKADKAPDKKDAVEKLSPDEEARKRERADAFGLPLPPRVLTIKRNERQVKLTTDMTLKELETFFKKALPEHEVFLLGAGLRAIPLRESLPSVVATRPYGPRYPREVTYALKHKVEDVVELASTPTNKGAKEDVKRSRVIPQLKRPRKGELVTTRTAGGELVAPGARWGEPYIPPEGSPLHTERNRHNFGRPYGQWIPD